MAGEPSLRDPPAGGDREVVLVRHAETEWSLAGRHTGRTDVPLTERGRALAKDLAGRLAGRRFGLVLVSPARRARETCELCGLAAGARVCEELAEWDYGAYEGLTSAQIPTRQPGWSLWRDGAPDGESPEQIGARADRVIGDVRAVEGDVAVFSHGHMLRVLGARWIGLQPAEGARLRLSTAAVCVLGYEHSTAALTSWNCP